MKLALHIFSEVQLKSERDISNLRTEQKYSHAGQQVILNEEKVIA